MSKYKTNETSRDYDIIVFGATGFTGQLVCEYFAKSTPENLKWAIAGRGKEKLESIRTNLTKINPSLEKLELIIADVKDQESIDAMVRSTKVLIDVAGPFTYYGPPVIDACIRFSTDYCDITGEIPYVIENMEKYHKIAQEKGIHIVSCCGYDSIPSDLGCLFVVNHIKEKYNRKTSYAKGFVGDFKGGPSGGTVASGLAVSKHSRKKDWINNPCCLNDPERKGVANVRNSSLFSYDRDFGWKGPNIMANINDRIVRRSDSILNYGDNFWYTENSGFKSFFKGIISSVVMWIIMGVLDSSLLRKFASLVLPKPGEGPSRQIIETGYWNYYLVGVSQKEGTEKRHRVTAHLSYNKDPGYGSTSIMLAESGLCLALQKNELPLKGGVLTPASSMGTLLIQRLQKVGFTFKIQKEEEI